MPAIQPARLKIQISNLASRFSAPGEFVIALKDLLDFYSDRTRKPGRGAQTISLLQAYNVPRQVIRQIEGVIRPLIEANSDQALELADILWQDHWLECRVLALTILGWTSSHPPESVIDRIQAWSKQCGDDRTLQASLAKGLSSLWKSHPDSFFSLLGTWVTATDPKSRKLGLRIIPTLVNDHTFPYLPNLFNFLALHIQRLSQVSDPDLLAAVCSLAERSPQETAYFLRRNLAVSGNIHVVTLIRQSLTAFPSPVKEDLLEFLHQRRAERTE